MTVANLAQRFARSFTQTELILYAGTNLMCPARVPSNLEQLGMMPVIGAGSEKQQPNVGLLAELEQATARTLCEVFHGEFAEPRFQSCTQANLGVFTALLKAGDTVLCLHADDGGHPSQNSGGMLAHLSVQLLPLPFDSQLHCLDDAATAALVDQARPKLVVFGPSVVLRPSVISLTAAATARIGATLMVDVSHVAGLIAGGVFPNPLDHGADLITASSYKTLGCPPAGFVVGRNRALESRIQTSVSPQLVSNYDAGRLFRFAAALESLRSSFGPYARAILANTSALRTALLDYGIPLLTPADHVFGTHQIVVTAGSKDDAARSVERLQLSGVTTSVCGVPGTPGAWGIRLGTQVITRRGMGVAQMTRIARIIAAALRSAGETSLRKEVERLTGDFPELMFCGETAAHAHEESFAHGR